jgi:hypothetical protein
VALRSDERSGHGQEIDKWIEYGAIEPVGALSDHPVLEGADSFGLMAGSFSP